MNNDDFGFTDTQTSVETAAKVTEDNKKNLRRIAELVLPLLQNLLDTSDKAMINWPNRKEPLEKLIKELKELTDV
jgi:hypothetical protein